MPYVVDATTRLLIACVRIKPDGLSETSGVVLAHQALSTTRDRPEKIRTIAQRFGFTDEKYFSRIFKARFGYSPSETFEQTRISPS